MGWKIKFCNHVWKLLPPGPNYNVFIRPTLLAVLGIVNYQNKLMPYSQLGIASDHWGSYVLRHKDFPHTYYPSPIFRIFYNDLP